MIESGSMGLPTGGAHQRTLTEVALDILRKGPGERITTSLQLQERLDVGSGTVQKALRQLVDAGAVRLRVKGHQGTVIQRYDPALLWRAADLGSLRLTLTPPGSIESRALATDIRAQLAAHHVTTEFDFVRGGGRRSATLAHTHPPVAPLSTPPPPSRLRTRCGGSSVSGAAAGGGSLPWPPPSHASQPSPESPPRGSG